MTILNRQKLNWSSLSRLERLTLMSSILIWTGVILFGGGLYVVTRNQKLEQQAYAQATVIAMTATATTTPTPTEPVFAVGWMTATTTPIPTSTPTYVPGTTPAPEQTNTTRSESTVAATPAQPGPGGTVPVNATPGPVAPPANVPPSRLVIPTINLDAKIVPIGWYVLEQDGYRYSMWQVADYAVSWHKTSAYPGHQGNVVLNGHHNIKGEIFRYLVDVEVGDHILLYAGDSIYYYAVEQKMILKEKGEPPDVRRENASWIGPTEDERLTMVTCWPYTNNTHRLVVVAKPISPPDAKGLEE